MKKMNPVLEIENTDSAWKPLYRVGGAAAMIAAVIFRRNLDAEWLLFRSIRIINDGPVAPPSTVIDWFMLLQSNRLLGLTLLKLFDMVNYALVGLILLALFAVLRRVNQFFMALAATLGFLGVAVYFASNQALTMLSLSKQYAAASSDAQRTMLLAAGQAVLVIHNNDNYPGIYLSFLFVTVSGLMISTVMLRSNIFSNGTAYAGILANGFGLGYYITLAFAPALEFLPISISAIFLLIWYLLVGLRLYRLGQASHGGVG